MILILTMGGILLLTLLFVVIYVVGKMNAKNDAPKGAKVDTTQPTTHPNDEPENALTSNAKDRLKNALLKLVNDKRTWINLGGGVGVSVFVDQVAQRIDGRLVEKEIAQLGRKAANGVLNTKDRLLSRVGGKIGSRATERLAARALAKAAQKAATQAATAAATGPIAPFVEAAELAFNMVSSTMDGMNLGGFANQKSQEMFREYRDEIDRYFREAVGNEPLVYGPYDEKFEDEVYDLITNETIRLIAEQITKTQQVMGADDMVSLSNTASENVCKSLGGFTTPDGKCSYTKDNCVAPWPMNVGDTYYEFKDGMCQVQPSAMRTFCENIGMNVTYDPNTRSCRLSQEYCRRYGNTGVGADGDCTISDGQAFAESIFGTTITRSLVNIFDPNNYKPCTDGWFPIDKNAALAADVISSIGTFGAGGIDFMLGRLGGAIGGGGTSLGFASTFANYFCQKGGSIVTKQRVPQCPAGMRQYGLHCYHEGVDTNRLLRIPEKRPCGPGQRDDKTSCWEDLKCSTRCDGKWNWKDGGLCHTKCSGCGCIKKTLFQRMYCPTGYEYDGVGMCYARSNLLQNVGVCPDDTWEMDPGGLICMKKCPAGYKRVGPVGSCVSGSGPRLKFKDRRVEFPKTTKDDFTGSTIGKYIQGSINSARDGNTKGLVKSLAGLAVVANPATLALGTSDLSDLGWQTLNEEFSENLT